MWANWWWSIHGVRYTGAIIVSRILYALPAWGGFLSGELKTKINAFFKRLKRFGYVDCVITISAGTNVKNDAKLCKCYVQAPFWGKKLLWNTGDINGMYFFAVWLMPLWSHLTCRNGSLRRHSWQDHDFMVCWIHAISQRTASWVRCTRRSSLSWSASTSRYYLFWCQSDTCSTCVQWWMHSTETGMLAISQHVRL